ncbi:MAG: DUF1801 domain-containing protein [Actinomycetota bacterium]|nr:DUF1801 domain-containing protein [Actinomycetota bacterium]MDP2287147.1 DUF1801 domain-containing protein [Actinomycetota bacterium]
MTVAEVDAYIEAFDAPQQKALNALRDVILQYLPDAEQGMSYSMPAFRVKGKVIAGMAGYKAFVSYYPHSGSVIEQVPEAAKYEGTPGSLHFPLNKAIPKRLVKQLIEVKLAMTFTAPADFWLEQGLGAPARRALASAGIHGMKELRKADLGEIAELHGIGPNALEVLTKLKQGK